MRASTSTLFLLPLAALSTSSALPSIPISSTLPSTDTLSPQVAERWSTLLSNLAEESSHLSSEAFKSSHVINPHPGIPGTKISTNEDYESIQRYLDCVAGEGRWVRDEKGESLSKEGRSLIVHKMDSKFASCDKRFYKEKDRREKEEEEEEWNVRESLKYRFEPSTDCHSILPRHLASTVSTPSSSSSSDDSSIPALSRTRFCQLIAHKSILLLGSTVQYSLHDLLLNHLTIEPQSCYGDLYCKEHALCSGILEGEKEKGRSERERKERFMMIENGQIDERVYQRLPLSPSFQEHPSLPSHLDMLIDSPSQRNVVKSLYPSSTYSTLLRYRRTDGLRPQSLYTHPSYQHPFNDVLEVNQQWVADARRSDVIVLEKEPLALPVIGSNETFDQWFYDTLAEEEQEEEGEEEKKLARLFEAVEEVTRRVWIPELIEALSAIRGDQSPEDQLVVYRGGWRIQPACAASTGSKSRGSDDVDWRELSPGDGPKPLEREPDLRQLLYRQRTTDKKERLQPLHVVYHNLQTIVQNEIARTEILPRFGIVYLDLENPLKVWSSGLLGGSTGGSGGGSTMMRSSISGDCLRYCFPSPGQAIESAFLGGLERLMELSWGDRGGESGEEEAEEGEQLWMGDGHLNLRLRMEERDQRNR